MSRRRIFLGEFVVTEIYRWIDDGEYQCDGYAKYGEEKQQMSLNYGVTWTDTGLIRRGALLAENSVHCGFVSGDTEDDFNPEELPADADLLYVNVDGQPNVKTDENSAVTEFTYTDVSTEEPVTFDGEEVVDTNFFPFRGAKDFEIIFHCRARQDEQTYYASGETSDGLNWDNLCNILEFKLERDNFEGVGLRFSKLTPTYLALNFRKSGVSSSTNYLLAPRTGEHADEWNFKITYQNNRFTMIDRFTNQIVKSTNNVSIDFQNVTFGDINDLTVAIGAAYNHTAQKFYRFGKCDIYEFSVKKL